MKTTAADLLREMIEFIGEHEGWYRGEMGDTYKGSWEENWLANACAVAGVPVPFEVDEQGHNVAER